MFTIARDLFHNGMLLCSRVVDTRPTAEILSHVLIEGKGDSIRLTACAPELELSLALPCELKSDFMATLPAQKLSSVCSFLPAGSKVECSFPEEGQGLLVCKKNRVRLNTLEAENYPLMEKGDLKEFAEIAVPSSALRDQLEKTHFCMASQDIRHYLNALMLEVDNARLRAVATDGHRMALCDQAVDSGLEEVKQVIVPYRVVEKLMRLLPGKGETRVGLGERHARFETGEHTFLCRLVDAEYPDYKSVLPESNENLMNVERGALQRAFRQVASLCDDLRCVKIALQAGGSLNLEVKNQLQEEARSELEVDYRGQDITVGFNVDYIIKAIDAVETERVRIYFNESSGGCSIFPQEGERYRYLVMPMRI